MYGNSKPTASLSSSLLARKGHARPAMRPQGFVGLSPATAHEDLGWNDMGTDLGEAHLAPSPETKPPVLRQIEELDEKLTARPPVAEPVAVEPEAEPLPQAAPMPRAAAARVAREVRASGAKGRKAAFTLRLDTDRHLRLRLASAVTRRSAQQLVTEALDAFLESLTEVEALARQVGPGGKRG